jgi:hypothetical protein
MNDLKNVLGVSNFVFKSLKRGIEVHTLLSEYHTFDQALTKLEQGSTIKAILEQDPSFLQNIDESGEFAEINQKIVEAKLALAQLDDGQEKKELEEKIKNLETKQNNLVFEILTQNPNLVGSLLSVDEEKEIQKNRLRAKRDEVYARLMEVVPAALNIDPAKITSLQIFQNLLLAVINEPDNQIPPFFTESVNRRAGPNPPTSPSL